MDNKKTFLRAAIMVGLMFAVLPMAIPSIAASPGEVILNDTVENITWSAAYWTNTNLWHITTPGGCNCTANNSWYYGREPPYCDYDIGDNWGYLRSQDIDLTGASAATLTFWTHWLTEDTGTKWDKKLVQVSTDGGSSWTTVKQLSGAENDKTISVSLSGYVNETIQIQFYFDTIDWMYNDYYGWCIDDIKVVKEGLQMPSIEVNKTVLDPETEEWVDEITANISDILRFNCTIHNSGTFNLTNINVTDILSESLKYADNATVDGASQEPDWNVSNQFGWNFTGPLEPCQTIAIEFNASVIKCGIDNNTQFAKGWCNDTKEWVYDNDTVTINVPAKPDLVITKNATYSDGNLTVNYTVSNCGPCACTDANESWVGIYINGTLNKTVFVPSLLKYNSSTNEVVIEGVECPCGTTLNVTVCADHNNSVVECNETNNCEVNEVGCPPGATDLNITDKFETWLNMTHYNITYTVTNIGSVNATNVTRTNITIDGPPPVENDTVKPLNASETHTATFGPYGLSGDNDTIRICADIDNNITTEYNESNNCLQNTLHKSTTIEVNMTGWWVKPVEGDSAEGEFHNTNTPIQDAIDNATDGCMILVHEGTYNENVVVDRELTIKAASSPIIDGHGMFGPAVNIQAPNVTLQGFIIRNFTANATYGIGAILVEGNGSTIEDNVIEHIYNATADPAGIGIDVHAYDVRVINNTVNNTGSIGIRVRDHWKAESTEPPSMSNNVSVENNTVYWTNNTGVLVTGFAKGVTIKDNEIYESLEPTPYNLFVHCGASDVVIEDNNIQDTYSNIVLGGCDNVTISGNTITSATNATVGSSYGKNIYILNDYLNCSGDVNLLSTNVTIMNNDILDGNYGVRIWNISAADATLMATTTTINYNNIVNNTVYGVENNIPTDVNATHNWWNDPCGPGPVGPGSGDNVSDNVTYTPWLDAPYPAGEPVESCARVYFEPENSSALYCNNETVEIWVNATGDLQSGQINLTYNQTCANVTNWAQNTTNFERGGGWTHEAGNDRISFLGNASQTGEYMIGTLTIHCVNSSEKGCNTTLNFDNGSELFDDYGKTLPVEWTNGTFNCTGLLCGDVNCNGEVNVGDATLVLNHWTDPGEYPLCNNWAGDVNCDFAVNVGDATLILNYFFGYPLNCCTV